MNTVLSSARTTPSDLDQIAELRHDPHIPLADRLALRVGLWLLLAGTRRAGRREDRDAAARHRLAVRTRALAEREAAWVRAAITNQYR